MMYGNLCHPGLRPPNASSTSACLNPKRTRSPTTMMGRRMSRGSFTIQSSFSSSLSALPSKPSFLTEGDFRENASATRPLSRMRNSSLVNRCLKNSRSWVATPLRARNSRAFLHVVQDA